MKEYVTLGNGEYTRETVIEKSRFIASAVRAETVEDAVAFIESKRKKFYDATHNCYAYIVGDKAKFSDDNEPQGTAGMPIYECIKANNLDCVCVVVTRYFGGVKLGAGGLVRAYNGAAANVLTAADKVAMRLCRSLEVTVEYSLLKTVRRALQGVAAEQNVEYADKVTLHYLILGKSSTTICDIISQNTLGKGQVAVSDEFLSVYGG
ncbi:MAG: YigZ family protein [Firmicutes bacterium]|nr:YigZ family protein [Bacillota bacterium]